MYKIIVAVSLMLLTSSCSVFKDPPMKQRVNHVVLCWLKESGNKVKRAQLVQISKDFKSIPGVLDVRAGEVITSSRDIVDSSYDVAIILSFHTEADLDAYLKHPDHVAAVKTIIKPFTKKVLVYDFIEKL
ncbi:MAG: Dabb family protein [Lentisphaeraceae bacterium]|nr:Dabb family protein [Lentisphaeraceae bacterium]